ncbi:hypothetical protein HanRHA438_Chr16g0765961 [Helianthus annuus]|nr:hypothetical protein HanRHA438_Chr16g0765961 [Helianthus annuus]
MDQNSHTAIRHCPLLFRYTATSPLFHRIFLPRPLSLFRHRDPSRLLATSATDRLLLCSFIRLLRYLCSLKTT